MKEILAGGRAVIGKFFLVEEGPTGAEPEEKNSTRDVFLLRSESVEGGHGSFEAFVQAGKRVGRLKGCRGIGHPHVEKASIGIRIFLATDGMNPVFELFDLFEECFPITRRRADGCAGFPKNRNRGWIEERGRPCLQILLDLVAVMLDGACWVVYGVEQDNDVKGSRRLAVIDGLEGSESLRLSVIQKGEVPLLEIRDGLAVSVGQNDFQEDAMLGLVALFALIAGAGNEDWRNSLRSL